MTLGGVTFLAPWVLLGLLSLPVIYWLLRVMPPAPKQQVFPPLRILRDVETDEDTPDSTPLWLLVLRMVMVSLLVLGLAKPVLDRAEESQSKLTLIVDDSWAGAAVWSDITREARNRLEAARRDGTDVVLLTTASDRGDAPMSAQAALDALSEIVPQPFPPVVPDVSDAVYLSGGIGSDVDNMDVIAPTAQARVVQLARPEEVGDGFRVAAFRAGTRGEVEHVVEAIASNGNVLGSEDLVFESGSARAEAEFELPAEIRNRVARLQIKGMRSAAAVQLLDDSWGRPVIGVLDVGGDTGSPLLSEPFYARTALTPYADIYYGDLDRLLTLSPNIIVMADSARTTDDRLVGWIERGGLLLRFAGERLAERPDDLVPVELRIGDRALGGALTWEEPQVLAPFAASSPFSGLAVPTDVTVQRQVMAEPGAETDARTWARLDDGAPLVTTDVRGEGRIVLFHVTASPEWSNLAVSGLYVDMLKRLLPLAKTNARTPTVATSADFAPDRLMDGFGQLTAPGLDAKSIPSTTTTASRDAPPGLYRQGTRRLALNAIAEPGPMDAILADGGYGAAGERSLAGGLLAMAAALLALDVLFSLLATGRRPRLPRMASRALAPLAVAVALVPAWADAQEAPPPEALELHFAYVVTGDSRVDQMSEDAMEGLVDAISSRTTIQPVGVRGVVPGEDELSYYPFLYFPVRTDTPSLGNAASEALNAFMSEGGTVVFDTADFAESGLNVDGHPGLRRLAETLDIPSVETVPETHVLTKSFYLIQVFPGRWANGEVWVEAAQSDTSRDGVSSVIIGSNDWAAAWAIDEDGEPLVDLENDIARQREMAVRFGVNLGMYALAGNYKADQVHTARLVERLGSRFPNDLTDEEIDALTDSIDGGEDE